MLRVPNHIVPRQSKAAELLLFFAQRLYVKLLICLGLYANWLCLVIFLHQLVPQAKKAMGRARALTGTVLSCENSCPNGAGFHTPPEDAPAGKQHNPPPLVHFMWLR